MYDAQKTANTIKKLLIDIGTTGKNMCQQCNLGVNTLSNIRRGDVKSIETFYTIADYLNCSVDYLLGRTNIPEVVRKDDFGHLYTVKAASSHVNTVINVAARSCDNTKGIETVEAKVSLSDDKKNEDYFKPETDDEIIPLDE